MFVINYTTVTLHYLLYPSVTISIRDWALIRGRGGIGSVTHMKRGGGE